MEKLLRKRHRVLALCSLLLVSVASAAPAAKIEPALLTAVQQEGTAEFVIQLADKADLAAATARAKTKAEKGLATVAALKAVAARSQPALSAVLDARGMAHRNYWVANAITTRGTLADLQVLAARADVGALMQVHSTLNLLSPYIARRRETMQRVEAAQAAKVDYVAKAMGEPEYGVALVNAPQVWALGFTGQGVVVGDHDIGVQWDHPALKKKYRGWNEATQTADHAYNWLNGFGMADAFCSDPTVPCDPNQHGTHTTGSMVGDDGEGNKIGVAPGSQWMACRSLLDPFVGVGTVPSYLDCMEWMIEPYPTGDTAAGDATKAPDVVNNSWGCVEGCAPPVLQDVNEATLAAGIMQVVSAGNDGQDGEAGCSTILFPLSVYESSFTVGANDADSEMAGFTSLGPVLADASMRTKPNITGPGVNVRSSVPDNGYDELSGTSMSGPHVAGVAALVMSSEPRLIGRVMDVRTLLERTANPDVKVSNTASSCGGTAATDIPNNLFGYGQVDALAAVLARPRLVTTITAPATAAVGEEFTVTVTVSQPAAGKIDATGVDFANVVAAPAGADFEIEGVVTSEGGSLPEIDDHSLKFANFVEPLAPGTVHTDTFKVRAGAAGEISYSNTAEADQVSPGAGATAKTIIGAGTTTPTTPTMPSTTTPGTSVSVTGGRFGGGSLGGGLLLLLGFGAAWRRARR